MIDSLVTDSSIIITTTQTTTTFFKAIQADLDVLHWLLLFLGWLLYWLNNLNDARAAAKGSAYIKDWWKDNFIEIPSSAIACLVLALMSKSVSTDLIDLHGVIAVFMTGYFSSQILNGLITKFKPASLKATATP